MRVSCNSCTDASYSVLFQVVWGSVGARFWAFLHPRLLCGAGTWQMWRRFSGVSCPVPNSFGCLFCSGQKCEDKFLNKVCNCVKIRDLTAENFGRKYAIFFVEGIAVSKKMTTFATH